MSSAVHRRPRRIRRSVCRLCSRISCSPRIFSDPGTLSRSFPAAQPSQLRSKVHDRHQECSLKPHPQAIPQPPAAGFPVHRLRFCRIYSNSRMAFSRCFAGTPLRFSGIECGKHFRAGLPSRVSRPQAIRKAPLRSAPSRARPGRQAAFQVAPRQYVFRIFVLHQ